MAKAALCAKIMDAIFILIEDILLSRTVKLPSSRGTFSSFYICSCFTEKGDTAAKFSLARPCAQSHIYTPCCRAGTAHILTVQNRVHVTNVIRAKLSNRTDADNFILISGCVHAYIIQD